MSLTKEVVTQENSRTTADRMELHLWKEGTFLRCYDWSAWLACRYLHEFKVSKRVFKGIDEAVAYIGFPETSLTKWLPEGAEQRVEGEKHLLIRLSDMMVTDELETMHVAYTEWKEAIPLIETNTGMRKRGDGKEFGLDDVSSQRGAVTLTSIMQRILAWPIESKSPLESMAFLADVKHQIAGLV